MSVPTSYTETQAKTYMHTLLGPVATALGWSVGGGSYDEPLNEALLMGGWSDISSVSGTANIQKLRALAKVAVWQWVVYATAAHVNIVSGPTELERSQLNAQAHKALVLAQADALVYMADYSVQIDAVINPHDPYAYYPAELRTRP